MEAGQKDLSSGLENSWRARRLMPNILFPGRSLSRRAESVADLRCGSGIRFGAKFALGRTGIFRVAQLLLVAMGQNGHHLNIYSR